MTLRKCPSCKDLVGAESGICPRCGVRFRAVLIRRIALLVSTAALAAWVAIHFAMKTA